MENNFTFISKKARSIIKKGICISNTFILTGALIMSGLSGCKAETMEDHLFIDNYFFDNNTTEVDDTFESTVDNATGKIYDMSAIEQYILVDKELETIVGSEFESVKKNLDYSFSFDTVDIPIDSPDSLWNDIETYKNTNDKELKAQLKTELACQYALINRFLLQSYGTMIDFNMNLAKAAVIKSLNDENQNISFDDIEIMPANFDSKTDKPKGNIRIKCNGNVYFVKDNENLFGVIEQLYRLQTAENKDTVSSVWDYNADRINLFENAIEADKLLSDDIDYSVDKNSKRYHLCTDADESSKKI